jgi:WhiB family redox-sensing transcriptional regulator
MSRWADLTTIVVMRGIQDARGTDRFVTASESVRTPCANADPELWFAERPAELNLAKALCAHCPIKRDCLAGALDRREPWGVWGGEIVQRGVVLAYKRGRGRPSNADRRLGLLTKVAHPVSWADVDERGSEPVEPVANPFTRRDREEIFHSKSA